MRLRLFGDAKVNLQSDVEFQESPPPPLGQNSEYVSNHKYIPCDSQEHPLRCSSKGRARQWAMYQAATLINLVHYRAMTMPRSVPLSCTVYQSARFM